MADMLQISFQSAGHRKINLPKTLAMLNLVFSFLSLWTSWWISAGDLRSYDSHMLLVSCCMTLTPGKCANKWFNMNRCMCRIGYMNLHIVTWFRFQVCPFKTDNKNKLQIWVEKTGTCEGPTYDFLIELPRVEAQEPLGFSVDIMLSSFSDESLLVLST